MWKANVTVAAVVQRDGRFLLVEEETTDGVRLNQPAGHLDHGESLIDAVAREALEETAHRFTPTELLGVYMVGAGDRDTTYLRFAFVGEVGAREDRELDHGIIRALWLTPDEVRARSRQHRSPLVMKCIDDYLAGQRFPLNVLYAHPSALRAR
jgi:8-oxo-dGTP pyrophosphatase MutT (NUDIX family)